jgi:hypothetical protein
LSPRDAVRGLAIGRIVIGVALVLFPRLAGRLSIGDDGARTSVTVMGRALGIRDAVLGGMLLHTLSNPQVAQRWISTCGAIDAVDFTAAFLARDGLPAGKRLAFYAIAGGSAAAHTALAPRVGEEPAS